MPLLTKVNYNDIFVSRKLDAIPQSLTALTNALIGKNILEINLSDNAFGPIGIKSFDKFVKATPCIKVFKITNCGIGPEGGEMVAAAISDLKLTHFSAGRDRLENKGIKALAEVFIKMESLEIIDVPQNGIKKEGMLALIKSFKNNKNLREIYIHDNWVKDEAATDAADYFKEAANLERVNISDTDMGGESALAIVKGLNQGAKKLKEFKCNYNEVDENDVACEVFSQLFQMKELKEVEFIGNMCDQALLKAFGTQFETREGVFNWKIPDECSDEEDEGDEEPDDEVSELISKVKSMTLE